MNRQCYTRPDKPMITAKPVINIATPDLTSTSLPRLVEVDRATQCHGNERETQKNKNRE